MTHENRVRLDFEIDENLEREIRREWTQNKPETDLSWDEFIAALLKLGLKAEKDGKHD